MDVAILPIEIASYIETTAGTLRRNGVNVFTINHKSEDKRYQEYKYNMSLSRGEGQEFYLGLSKALAENFDVLNYAWGEALFPDFSDVFYAKSKGRVTVPSFLGSDVRRYKVAKSISPFFENDNQPDDGRKERKLEAWACINDGVAITGSEEMELLVNDHFSVCHNVGYGGMDRYLRRESFHCKNKRLKVVHAPSNPKIKGTDYVRAAIAKIKEEFGEEVLDYVEISGVGHSEALDIYGKADVIIDQFKIGGLGYLAHEAMALGKPVITYVSPQVVELLPEIPPVINSTQDEIYDSLMEVLSSKRMRDELGVKARSYIVKYHTERSFFNRLCHAFTKKEAVKTGDYAA